MRHLILCFLLVVCYVEVSNAQTSSQPEKAGFSTERLQRYEGFLQQEIEEGKIAGAVSYIVRKGEVAHRGSYGLSNLAEKTPMTEDKIFHIMSMTKPIVSVAFMMLYEEGHFQLNDKLADYLPAAADLRVTTDVTKGLKAATVPLENPILISHVLTHTAGFSHGLGGTALDNEIARALYYSPQKDIESRVNTLLSLPLVSQPGEQWYYSASPDILSLLIEKFSGMTTEEFLQTRLFDPLNMNDTGYNIPESKMSRRTFLHSPNKEGVLKNSPMGAPVMGNTVFGGSHGLMSTASDYIKFAQMLLNNGEWNGKRYLSRKTLELMTINHVGDKQGPGAGFGLGFGMTTDLAKTNLVGSVGQYYWSGAYCTYFFVDPKEQMVAVLMTQTAPYSDYYNRKFRQLVYQAIND